LDGDEPREVTTAEPGTVVTELTSRYGGAIPGLTVARPSLEEIYLDLIGQTS
jgi:ABC-2 type transport system ATP-binding protein